MSRFQAQSFLLEYLSLMDIKENYSLSPITTFRIGGLARYFVIAQNLEEIKQALRLAKRNRLSVFIMAGGSNLLVSDRGFQGLVIKIAFPGIEIVSENEKEVLLKVGSGEVWDRVTEFAVQKGFWGIENLSNIPGLTGAIPVQNVGAYGQEASQVVENVEAFDLAGLELKNFNNRDCDFVYRASNFNTKWKNKYAILSVTFRLSKLPKPNLTYIDVKKYFDREKNANPGLADIRKAIIEIRKNKFPDLSITGTAGSFFKNIFLTPEQYASLTPEVQTMLAQVKDKFPQKQNIKIPAAFLIDQLGLKGSRIGDAKLSEKHALVIVNEGKAQAADVAKLFKLLRQTVYQKTGFKIMPEPEFVGFDPEELKDYFKLHE